MCVIVYSPAGIALPSDETLKKCFKTNPNGAGFMITHGNAVRIRKGFMSCDALLKELHALPNSTEAPVILHFRITTQGFTNAANTHPFPISAKDSALTAKQSLADVGLAHNGIIELTTAHTSFKSDIKEEFSDTFYFVRDYASLIIRNRDYWRDADTVTLLSRLADSKLAILGSDGHVELIGAFVDAEDGCIYSNRYHEYMFGNKYSFGFDDDDYSDAIPTRYAGIGTTAAQTVRASFLPDDVWLWNDSDGTMIEASGELYAIDAAGHVYEYYEPDNVLLPFGHTWCVLTDLLAPVEMDKDTAVMFSVLLPE